MSLELLWTYSPAPSLQFPEGKWLAFPLDRVRLWYFHILWLFISWNLRLSTNVYCELAPYQALLQELGIHWGTKQTGISALWHLTFGAVKICMQHNSPPPQKKNPAILGANIHGSFTSKEQHLPGAFLGHSFHFHWLLSWSVILVSKSYKRLRGSPFQFIPISHSASFSLFPVCVFISLSTYLLPLR